MSDMDEREEFLRKVINDYDGGLLTGEAIELNLPAFDLFLRKAKASGLRDAQLVIRAAYWNNFSRDEVLRLIDESISKLDPPTS